MSSNVTVVLDHVNDVVRSIEKLVLMRVMVGIPAEKAAREGSPINNAALGYIHENGAPEVNIPARPFLLPGVRAVQQQTIDGFKVAGELAFAGRPEAVERQFHRIGLAAVASIKAVINAGVPPPLAESTLEARTRRGRKGAKQELKNRAAGLPPAIDLAKPLIDTGQLRNSITYVLRGNV